jgi:lipopolysaccharide transport system permease protein
MGVSPSTPPRGVTREGSPSSQDHVDVAGRVIRLAPTRGWVGLRLGDVWEYRELLWFLAVRDIKVRYKQTVLGAAWAVLQPVATAALFAFLFGRLAKLPSDGVPYGLFALTGVVLWNFFANAVGTTSLSLVGNRNLVSKVYFPRLCVPIASIIVFLVDLMFASLVIVAGMLYWQQWGGWRVVFAIPMVALAFVSALGVSLWLSAIAARYRDVRHVVPFMLQFWLFASPVAYSTTLLPDGWEWVAAINPMAGALEGFRWALIGTSVDLMPLLIYSTVTAVLVTISGAYYFRRTERDLADII